MMELHPILETNIVPNPDLWFVVSAFGDCPSMRAGHTCTFVRGTENRTSKLYVIGGANPSETFDNTYVLDLDTLSWDIVDCTGLRARYEHAAFVPEDEPSKIYLFGGADQSGNMNSVQVLDTITNQWETVEVNGTSPSPRTHHTSAVVGNKLIVYSGGERGAEPVADRKVYSFDAKTHTWTVLSVKGDSPKPRQGHAMAAIGSKVYLHGGMATSKFYDDFHVLDLQKNTWNNISRKGVPPSPRAAHSLVSSEQSLYVFGGFNQNGALDDIYRFSTENNTWSKIELQGPPPASRLDFGVCVIALERSVSSEQTEGSTDLLIAGAQAQDILDTELSKPDSAKSNGSRCGSEDGMVGNHDNQSTVASSTTDCPGDEDPPHKAKSDETATTQSYKLCLINGGMDHLGQIFDDTLVFLLK